MIPDTPKSLLARLQSGTESGGWVRLTELYSPLLQRWARHFGLQAHDADDLVQEVLSQLIAELPTFEYNRERGLFRSWLRTVTVNRMRVFWRTKKPMPIGAGGDDSAAGNQLDQLADSDSGLTRLWNQEHDEYIVSRLKAQVRPEFDEKTWQAFTSVAEDSRDPAEVAVELGMSRGAVYVAKSRVLKRLRDELDGLADI